MREFARAVFATNPINLDPEAARAAGYDDVVAPPTFAVVVQEHALAQLLADPDAGIDFSRVVHGDQRFTSTRPIVAGDLLTATLTVSSVKSLGRALDGHGRVVDHRRVRRARRHRDLDARDPRRRLMAAATAAPDFAALAVGDVVAEREFPLTRDSLVRYAGASGDFNPIHYRDDVAASVGLPGVLAHGMLTMGFAVQPVVDWAGDPGRVADYQVRFTRPVVVDPEQGALVTVVAKVGQLDESATVARIDLTVKLGDDTVLGKAQVRVALG